MKIPRLCLILFFCLLPSIGLVVAVKGQDDGIVKPLIKVRDRLRAGVPSVVRKKPRAYFPLSIPAIPQVARPWLSPIVDAFWGQPRELSLPKPAMVFPALASWPNLNVTSNICESIEISSAAEIALSSTASTNAESLSIRELQSYKLTVMTANLWLLPPPAAVDHIHRLDLFADIVLTYQPDLIFVQEIWLPSFLIRLRNRLPHYNFVTGSLGLYNPSGLAICSRWPIKNAWWSSFELTRYHNLVELLAVKGCLEARLETPIGPIEVIDTHLYSATGKNDRELITKAQFLALSDKALSCSLPVIIAGDFNLTASDVVELSAGRFVHEDDLLTQSVRSRKNRKIDHILVKPSSYEVQITSRPIFEPPVSDHLPVLATITFKLPPSGSNGS